ncbi:VOC family protein [Streptococcus gallolyticus]|uniref:Putative glyoxylase family protein (Lactoylglutathione lyase) n=1 Tax=Streptococcus gallolyticus TaxID=315405 RepID=A0A139R376_9STRE|nr:VOC family protein [Streptococcus gallolyticus]KXT67373.1 putative glyoxylase family protein (Lactoylglutathione lyase) [Streptococcus gallolyticus]KXU09232.1 putative glyoxylase family protein (Lactoylglutathione lyase) [Streptococcus gallolyticus]
MIKIEHIGVWVHDLETMKEFFAKYFQTTASERYHNPRTGFSSYFLSFPDNAARLELCHREDISEGVDQLTAQLENDGYHVLGQPRTTGDGYYESVVCDPEGNRLELTV